MPDDDLVSGDAWAKAFCSEYRVYPRVGDSLEEVGEETIAAWFAHVIEVSRLAGRPVPWAGLPQPELYDQDA